MFHSNRMVGIAAINHGTTMNGLMGLFQMLNTVSPDESLVGSLAPSVPEMVQDSAFMKKLNDGGDTVPGVIHSNIVTMYDEIITPYESCFQHGAGVTNVVLQDLCAISFNEHLTIINSMVVLRFILNQLDPDTAKPANCFPRF
ncbi:hypothetical protein BGZ74_006019 [Mortierella antarctica]|nr:hypothetical protein BGZ74_006019 [Mortierella antarctica]